MLVGGAVPFAPRANWTVGLQIISFVRVILLNVFNYVASISDNLSEQKKKSSTPRGFPCYTNMAAISLSCNANVAAAASSENAS